MSLELHSCADFWDCGRSFFAVPVDDLKCPYCGELAHREGVELR